MKQETEIKNSKQALRESIKLDHIWSQESRLTQRILIYIAKQLEQLNKKRK